MIDLSGKTLLVTGGTGSFGTAFIRTVLARHDVHSIRVFSRDELKQSELQNSLQDSRLRWLLGDVRDGERLKVASRGVDVIVHAAALKQVPACEYNPFEAIQTNIMGAQNIISAAIDNGVPLTMALSTDKAVNPANLYGATKLCAEKIVAQAGVYAPGGATRFASVRYGNVVGSRGSVVPIFKAQAETGKLTITDERMTRFWITLEAAVEFVLSSMELVSGRRGLRAQDPEHADHGPGQGARARRRDRHRRHPPGREAARGPADRGRGPPVLRRRRPLRDPALAPDGRRPRARARDAAGRRLPLRLGQQRGSG